MDPPVGRCADATGRRRASPRRGGGAGGLAGSGRVSLSGRRRHARPQRPAARQKTCRWLGAARVTPTSFNEKLTLSDDERRCCCCCWRRPAAVLTLRERRSTSQDLTTDADARRVNSLDSDRPRRIICPSFA